MASERSRESSVSDEEEESISIHSSGDEEDEEIDSEEVSESEDEGANSLVFEGFRNIVSELDNEDLEQIQNLCEKKDEIAVDIKELPNLIYKLSILMLDKDEKKQLIDFITEII